MRQNANMMTHFGSRQEVDWISKQWTRLKLFSIQEKTTPDDHIYASLFLPK